jgi:hypothetical protein
MLFKRTATSFKAELARFRAELTAEMHNLEPGSDNLGSNRQTLRRCSKPNLEISPRVRARDDPGTLGAREAARANKPSARRAFLRSYGQRVRRA